MTRLAAWAACAVALGVLLLALPGGGVWTNAGPGAGAGTPAAVVFAGVVSGTLNALVAAAIVLVYRSARIVNLAQAALGVIGATLTVYLMVLAGWSYWIAAPAGVAVSAGVGAAVELGVVRRFFDAPRLTLTVMTVAVANLLSGATGLVLLLPIFPEDASPLDLGTPLRVPFERFAFRIGGFPQPFGSGHLLAIGVGASALVGLWAFLRFTRAGVAVRASAENAERAELLGISVRTLSTLVWAIAGAMSGLAIVLGATADGALTVSGVGPAALLPALAAAVAGRLHSLPVTAAAAIAITVATRAVAWSYPAQTAAVDAGLFAIVVLAIVARRRVFGRLAATAESWRAVAEARPLRDAPRALRLAPGALLVASALLLPWIVSTDLVFLASFGAIEGIVLLSLVVLTGWAGQVSLGQYALVAVGAVAGGALTTSTPVPFWLAVPAAAAVTAGLAVLIGIPALRVRGLLLAVATLAFAFAVEGALFDEDWFGWLLPDGVDRPTLFLLDFSDERSMYYLCLAALAGAVAVVARLRASRTGRVLIAARENEPNLESFGVSAVRAKLLAFCISGALCGTAGALLAHQQREVVRATFAATRSLDTFLLAVVGGIGSVWGALAGTAYSSALRFVNDRTLTFLAGPIGTLAILWLLPGGLASFGSGVRDSVLGVIAHRRAGRTADAIPLAEPSGAAGLAAIGDPDRYAPASRLYGVPARHRAGTEPSVLAGGDR